MHLNRRDEIRDLFRELLKGLEVNNFSARTAALKPKDLPACIVYSPGEKLSDEQDKSRRPRTHTIIVDVAFFPDSDPEKEVSAMSDKIEHLLLDSEELQNSCDSLKLLDSDWDVFAWGEKLAAAIEHTYEVQYTTYEEE